MTVDQRFAKGDGGWVVNLQDSNGGSADASQPDQDGAVITKVPSPFMSARMKQGRKLLRNGVNAGKIRSLVSVAIKAGKSEVIGMCAASVAYGDDVIHLEGEMTVLLRQEAIFANTMGPVPNQLNKIVIHA